MEVDRTRLFVQTLTSACSQNRWLLSLAPSGPLCMPGVNLLHPGCWVERHCAETVGGCGSLVSNRQQAQNFSPGMAARAAATGNKANFLHFGTYARLVKLS